MPDTETGKPARPTPRRSREQWLETALDVLAEHGEARIRVRDLSAALGVTTGSFYRHFRNRDDFVQSIVVYWQQRFTSEVAEWIEALPGPPRERLVALAIRIVDERLTRHDVAVRAWATHEPGVMALVRSADEERFTFVRQLFAELGFRNADLDVRARTYVTYYSLEGFIQVRQSDADRRAEVRRRVELLTQPSPS